jgi:hypothetical protein
VGALGGGSSGPERALERAISRPGRVATMRRRLAPTSRPTRHRRRCGAAPRAGRRQGDRALRRAGDERRARHRPGAHLVDGAAVGGATTPGCSCAGRTRGGRSPGARGGRTSEAGRRQPPGYARTAARRGRILDRAGALVTDRAVVDVAVEARRVREPATTAGDSPSWSMSRPAASPARSGARGAGGGRCHRLRQAAYKRIAYQLQKVRGISLLAGSGRCAEQGVWTGGARQRRVPTAEQLERLGSAYGQGDEIGQWGLQASSRNGWRGSRPARS